MLNRVFHHRSQDQSIDTTNSKNIKRNNSQQKQSNNHHDIKQEHKQSISSHQNMTKPLNKSSNITLLNNLMKPLVSPRKLDSIIPQKKGEEQELKIKNMLKDYSITKSPQNSTKYFKQDTIKYDNYSNQSSSRLEQKNSIMSDTMSDSGKESPFEKYLRSLQPKNSQHPLPNIEGILPYEKYLKRQATLRTFGSMFDQPQFVQLKACMTDRKETYNIFHKKKKNSNLNDLNKIKLSNGILNSSNKINNKGAIYANEFWSDSYYQKVFKNSKLCEIEDLKNSQKLKWTTEQSQEKMKSKEEKQKRLCMRRISANHSEILNNYINLAQSHSKIPSPRIPTSPSEKYNDSLQNQSKPLSYRSILLQQANIEQQDQGSIFNSNILSHIVKKSAFSQNSRGSSRDKSQLYYITDNLVDSCVDEQQGCKHLSSQISIEDDLQNNIPLDESQYDKDNLQQQEVIKQSSDKSSFKLDQNSETSRFYSSDQSTKASPFRFSNKNNSFKSPQNVQNLNIVKNNLQKQNILQSFHRKTQSEINYQKLQKQQCIYVESSDVQDYKRYQQEINLILLGCQDFQNDNYIFEKNVENKIKKQKEIDIASKRTIYAEYDKKVNQLLK